MDQSRKKILFLITKSNYGGAQRYVHELATNYQSQYEVIVACGGRGLMVKKLEADGVRTIEIKNFQRDISLLKELGAIRELWKLYKNEKPDVVHLNSSKAGLLGALVARAARVPRIIFTIHGWAFHEPRPWWWKGLTWLGGYLTVLLAHRSIPISQYDVAHSHLYGLKWKLTPVIYNGVAETLLIPREQARTHLVGQETADRHQKDIWIITTAELHPKKNLSTAIAAVIAHNTNPEIKHRLFYIIMGDGVLRHELEAQIMSQQATDYVYLCGYINDAKKYLSAGDIFLLPSKQEGLPFALLEAGIAGIPSIASNVCGLPEVITHETHGLLFDPYDVDSLAEALYTMSHQPLTQMTYGTMIKENVRDNFSLSNTLEQTRNCY
ncbi:MAG: glycosyltransferase [Candidatus Paceibacteria bacterium]